MKPCRRWPRSAYCSASGRAASAGRAPAGSIGSGPGAYLTDDRVKVAELCIQAGNTLRVAAAELGAGQLKATDIPKVDAVRKAFDPVCRAQAGSPPDRALVTALERALNRGRRGDRRRAGIALAGDLPGEVR